MRYRSLGHTGLYVSELCLGTMTFGGNSGMWRDIGQVGRDDAGRLLRTAFDAGVNFVDTADVYAEGRAEEILGQALRDTGIPREELVVATKFLGRTHDGPNGGGGSRLHMMNAVKASLKRLQLDHIDLYQMHGFDSATPMEETLEALDLLVQHGHVRYVGLSNWAAWQVAKAAGITERRNLVPVASLQAYYTVATRDLEREIVPMLNSEGIGLMVWSPLAGGLLSGKYDRDTANAEGRNTLGRRDSFDFPPVNRERAFDAIDVLRDIAGREGRSVAQIALAWLLHQPVVTSVIVGARRVEQLQDNLGAAEVRLTAEDLATLDEAGRPPPEYPGWMLQRQGERREVGPPQQKGRQGYIVPTSEQ